MNDRRQPTVLKTIAEVKTWRQGLGPQSVGFVPTMGALHAGHAELLRRAREQNDRVILSIFVNPTQFNDPQDLEKYPRTLENDLQIAADQRVDAVWTPDQQQMYPDDYRFKVSESKLSTSLEGAFRPGHFDGMLTVVLKLLQVTAATRAYFGEKDYQQLLLVQEMARAFFLPMEIIGVPTVREEDGLALSSRNIRLTADERDLAPRLYKIISRAADAATASTELQRQGFAVDYVEDLLETPHKKRRLAAVTLGQVRLIDNVEL